MSAPAVASGPTLARPPALPATPVVCAHTGWRLLEIAGADALSFLHSQLSSDVQSLDAGDGQNWSYNSPKGRMLANGALWRAPGASDRVLMVLAADLADALCRRLSMFVLRAKVTVQDASGRYALLGLAGSESAATARGALGVSIAPLRAVPFNGDATAFALADGRIVVACPSATAPIIHAALARHAATAGADLWQLYGIVAGVASITAATTDMFVPQAVNWDVLGGVNFQKGCYPGQEIVARMQYLGKLKERLYGLRTDAENVAAAMRLYAPAFGEQACGTVVNAAPNPTGGTALLAVLQQDALADVRLGALDGPRLAPFALPYSIPAAAGRAEQPPA